MQSNLEIKKNSQNEVNIIKLSGRIDAYWSGQLLNFLSDEIRSGNYDIKFDLSEVDYLSSAGIRVFLQTVKQLKELGGACEVISVSPNVRSVFEMTGLLELITGNKTNNEDKNLNSGSGWKKIQDRRLDINIYQLDGGGFSCSLSGDPENAIKGEVNEKDFRLLKIEKDDYSIGLGALGRNFGECVARAGEFLAIPGAAMYMPTDNTRVCDFSLKHENLLPEIGSIYSCNFKGQFQKILKLKNINEKQNLLLGDALKAVSAMFNGNDLFCVIIGEAVQVVGAFLNKPFNDNSKHDGIFNFPEIRDNINFTTEPAYAENLILAAGVFSKKPDEKLSKFVRPITNDNLNGHFHAAVFSFTPLKKDCIDLNEIISKLFENSKLESVVHLINDNRPINGIGETEFKNCVLWCGEIKQ